MSDLSTVKRPARASKNAARNDATDADKTESLDALLTGDDEPKADEPKADDKPKASAKPKTPRAPKPPVPEGWEAPLGHRTYMIRRIADPAEGESKWGVMCRAHGTVYGKPVASITEGDKIAAKPNRPSWCRKCKAAGAGGK